MPVPELEPCPEIDWAPGYFEVPWWELPERPGGFPEDMRARWRHGPPWPVPEEPPPWKGVRCSDRECPN